MRKTLTTAALLLAFSCPTLAGEMHTPPAPAPPAAASDGIIQGGQPAQEPAADGETPNNATDALTQIVLTVLVSLLP